MTRGAAAHRVIVTGSADQTIEEGRRLAASLSPGDVVVLSGTLGAGKTVFVRGIAEGLGIDGREVHSPSFTIMIEHAPGESGLGLVHVDLYRVDDPAEIEDLGLADAAAGPRVMAVEWGEKLPGRLRRGAILVTIEDAGDDRRRLSIEHLP